MLSAVEYASFPEIKNLEKKMKRDPYYGTPFQSYRSAPSKTKGVIIEKMTERYLSNLGITTEKRTSTEHDIRISNLKIEIKGSSLWDGSNSFKWQQIRDNQDYDALIFVAIYPTGVRFYYATKKEVFDSGMLALQHGGKKSVSNTSWLTGVPSDFPFMKEIADASYFS